MYIRQSSDYLVHQTNYVNRLRSLLYILNWQDYEYIRIHSEVKCSISYENISLLLLFILADAVKIYPAF